MANVRITSSNKRKIIDFFRSNRCFHATFYVLLFMYGVRRCMNGNCATVTAFRRHLMKTLPFPHDSFCDNINSDVMAVFG